MRRATEGDIPALVDMLRRFHDLVQPPYEFRAQDSAEFFAGIMVSGVVLIKGAGFLCGIAMGQPANAAYLTAHEIYWWSEDGHGGALLQAFEEWAAEQGCGEVVVSHRATDPAVGRYLRARGYEMEASALRKTICV